MINNFLVSGIVYTISAASETWLINWLKIDYFIELPIFFGLLQNSGWPISLFIYILSNDRKSRNITSIMYRNYLILGILASFVSITKVSGLTTLPAVLYTIASNTEIVFETVMTKVILNRSISILQAIAVSLVCIGVIISVYNPVTKTWGDSVSKRDLIIGLILTISSRFASSLNSILADKFLKIDTKSYIGCLECAIVNSIIPFFLLPSILIFIPEYKTWNEDLIGFNKKGTVIVTLLCFAIAITKNADRLSKFFIISKSSTMYFAAIDANMKVITGIGSFFLFDEIYYWPQILGFMLIIIALVIMYYDRSLNSFHSQKYIQIPNEDDEKDFIAIK